MASSSLSSVVSNLVRASMGSSLPSTVTDDDLDRRVAELIVREAKKKAERYGQQGIRAYISSNLDSNAPKPNKRFLSSIIKSTDDHNKTILKAQALAAQEIKREREEQERKQRRARAEEAAEAERLRRSGGSRHGSSSGSKRKCTGRDDESDSWDRWDGRTAERKKVSRNWESWDGRDEDEDDVLSKKRRRSRSRSRSTNGDRERASGSSRVTRAGDEEQDRSHRRRRSRSASPRRHKSGDEARERDRHGDDHSRRHRRRRSHERSHRHSHRSRSRSRRSASPSSQAEDLKSRRRKRSHSPKYALDDVREDTPPSRSLRSASAEPNNKRSRRHAKEKESHRNAPSPSSPPTKSQASSSRSKVEDDRKPVQSTSRQAATPDPESRSPSPGPHPPIQLPSKMDRYFEESYDPRLDVAPLSAPVVPATGLIDNAEFEGWDAMLELIRIRREDKEEKKRMERLGLLPPKEKSKTKKKGVAVADSAPAVADRWTGEAVSIMDIEYKKRGSVREWDLGKEGF